MTTTPGSLYPIEGPSNPMEVAMNDSVAATARLKPPLAPADVPRRHPASLRSVIVTWEDRKRFRLDLERMAETGPHLIDDIGLTRRQVAAEIAKPFWRA